MDPGDRAINEEDQLAAQLRDAFDLESDAHGLEVELSATRQRGSSAAFLDLGPPGRYAAGQVLGDFEILGELGRGGMGVVYRARQLSLSREVALKVLPGYGLRGPLAIQRFRNEARAAARLHHTNIVPIYARGEERGQFYYAMELIDGAGLDVAIQARSRILCPSNPSLTATPTRSDASPAPPTEPASQPPEITRPASNDAVHLHRHRQDYAHLARMMAEVAEALEHAHRAGIIHRDIKPQNLLVGLESRLHITDFGLARLADAPSLTMSGEVMGTPAYLSPEQVRGDQSAIDHRTDIYSFGVTLYELLTLRRPFEGESREQIMTAIREREPLAPRRIDPHIPRDMQTICLKAMDKDVNRRYATAADLADDLRRFADGRPIRSRPIGPITRAVKWARRHKAASTALTAAFVVLALTAGLAASLAAADRQQADAIIDDVYRRMVFVDFRPTPDLYAQLEQAEALGGDARRLRFLEALATLMSNRGSESPRRAAEQLASLCADYPNYTEAGYLLAAAHAHLDESDRVLAEVAVADALPDRSAAAWFFRGLALQRLQPQEAMASYEKARQLRAAEGEVFVLASLHLASARNQQMYNERSIDNLGVITRALEEVAQYEIYSSYPHNLLAIAHRLAGEVYAGSEGTRGDAQMHEHFDASLRWARAGQVINPADPRPALAEGMTLESMDELAAAYAAFSHAADISSPTTMAACESTHYRWRVAYWLGLLDEATADLDRHRACLEREPWFYDHVYPLLVLAERGELEQAETEAYAISQDASTNALAVIWTASCLRLLGQPAAAEQHLTVLGPNIRYDVGVIPEQSPEWIHSLFELVAGRRSLGQLLDLADDSAERPWRLRGEAEFHAALSRLAAGDRAAAVTGLERAWRSYDAEVRYTYHAKLLLRKLRLDPNWPPWLPGSGVDSDPSNRVQTSSGPQGR